MLYENSNTTQLHLLGTVRYCENRGRFYFHPARDLALSDTQLWQIMCYVVDLNNSSKVEGTKEP